MKNGIPILIAMLFAIFVQSHAQLQVGDPGVTFDQSKFDPDYPQMSHWATAGVRGGIPFRDQMPIKKTIYATNSAGIESAINDVANLGGGAVLLKNGTYNINSQIDMKSNVSLIGESRSGVKCVIAMNSASAFYFGDGIHDCGIYRMTIEGSWGTPTHDWNIGTNANNELPGNENVSVKFVRSIDCWLDDVSILNSADFPMRCNATHTTFRNLIVDGVHNKQGGAHGYFFILDGYNLITKCYITHLRHISLQGDGVRYNVVYDNDFDQEISFHSDDDGDNLVEQNRVTLPASMPGNTPNYYAIMGPWSTQHQISARPNYLYKNTCLEKNHNNATPWSNPNVVYYGPHYVKPADPLTNFTPLPANMVPIGGTLYPVVLGSGQQVPVTGVSVSPANLSMNVGGSSTLAEVVSPSNATNQSVSWTSSNALVASVNSSGVVSALASGSATITATTSDGSYTDTCVVTVASQGGGQNLAAGKPATTSDFRATHPPANAFDGDTETRWTAKDYPQWLEVDLGSVQTINKTETVCHNDRAYQYRIEVKATSGGSYTQIVDRSSNATPGSAASPIVDTFSPVSARFVRITILGASGYSGIWISLMEFRVFGTAGSGGSAGSVTVNPSDDAYLQGSTAYNSNILRVESGNRVSYLKFDASGATGSVTGGKLTLKVSGDAGNGTLRVFKGNSNNWTESNLSTGNAPGQGAELGSVSGSFGDGSDVVINLSSGVGSGTVSLIVKMDGGGNDVSFSSSEGATGPELKVDYQ